MARSTFVGIEESVFRHVALVARSGLDYPEEVPVLPDIAPFYSAISLLRDGSIIGPAEFFSPVDVITV